MSRCAIVLVVALLVFGAGPSSEPEPSPWLPLPEGPITRIAFGSGIFQWNDQPIWQGVIAREPDLFIFNGDAIYADFDGENVYDVTPEILRREWGRLGAIPNFQAARADMPFMATWDNHDYGKHDGGAEFVLKAESQQIFLDFFGEPPNSPRRRTEGVHQAKTIGPEGQRVQIILLDNRYFKSPYKLDPRSKEEKAAAGLSGSMGKYVPNADPEATLLGIVQWRWLGTQLRKPADVRFIISGTQIIPDQKGMEEWGNFPKDRQRLFKLLEETGAQNTLLLTGNVHFTEVSALDGLYEFTASGMDHINEAYANAENSYRVAGPCTVHNFGLVEIDWESESGPAITFSAVDEAGGTVWDYELVLD
jgi:alkaline phosphatase D